MPQGGCGRKTKDLGEGTLAGRLQGNGAFQPGQDLDAGARGVTTEERLPHSSSGRIGLGHDVDSVGATDPARESEDTRGGLHLAWLITSLRENPGLAIFLTLAIGFVVGRVRVGSFRLGNVVGTLLAGVLVGQIAGSRLPVLGYTVPYAIGNILLTARGSVIVMFTR